MRKLLLMMVATILLGCQNAKSVNEEALSIVLNDIAAMQARRSPDADQSETFSAYRRLESLTRNRVNLDELSAEFFTDMLGEEVLANRTKFWVEWVVQNMDYLTTGKVQAAIDNANEEISLTLPDNPDLAKLRVKNGISANDTTQDKILRRKYMENKLSLELKYPVVLPK